MHNNFPSAGRCIHWGIEQKISKILQKSTKFMGGDDTSYTQDTMLENIVQYQCKIDFTTFYDPLIDKNLLQSCRLYILTTGGGGLKKLKFKLIFSVFCINEKLLLWKMTFYDPLKNLYIPPRGVGGCFEKM